MNCSSSRNLRRCISGKGRKQPAETLLHSFSVYLSVKTRGFFWKSLRKFFEVWNMNIIWNLKYTVTRKPARHLVKHANWIFTSFKNSRQSEIRSERVTANFHIVFEQGAIIWGYNRWFRVKILESANILMGITSVSRWLYPSAQESTPFTRLRSPKRRSGSIHAACTKRFQGR